MNDNERVFLCWAPPERLWSLWAKPVLFAQEPHATAWDDAGEAGVPAPRPLLPRADGTTALILELPGELSVAMGLGLARLGYAPVPLFNGCPGPVPFMVPVSGIAASLWKGAKELERVSLPTDAPPAFLLDNGRMAGGRLPMPGQFDNRWVVFAQDFPSGRLLRERGISRAIVLCASAAHTPADLAHVLRRWREAGVEILRQPLDSDAPAEPLPLAPLSRLGRFLFRVRALVGLHRGNVGGFGSMVPFPHESHGGRFG